MWQKNNNQLQRQYVFNDFTETFAFMTEVAMIAEKQRHHPTWTNFKNTVDISLSTPDAGNIVTNKDRELAEAIDRVYEKYNRDTRRQIRA